MKKVMLIISMVSVFSMLSLTGKAAEQENYAIGKSAGAELKIGLATRFVATGEAGIAVVDDLNATTLNPAGLAQTKGMQAGFMHNIYLQETSVENISYAQNLFAGSGLGVNVMFLNFGEMDKVTADSNNLPVIEDTFTPVVYVVTVGYGQQLMETFAVGAALKLYGLSIDTESYTSVAIDLGAQYKVSESLTAALTVQNLGTSVADSQLSMLAKAGVAYNLPVKVAENDTWNLLLDINLPFGDVNYTSANIGTEYWYNKAIALRAGYIVKDTGDLGGMTGLTAGLGGKLMLNNIALNLDYALLSFGDLGLTHQIAIGVGF